MRKRVSPGEFVIGGIATYTLDLRVSEYVDAGSIAVTDVMPNGVCPLSSDTNYVTGAPGECGPEPGTDPTGADFADVQQNADGTFTLRFTDVAGRGQRHRPHHLPGSDALGVHRRRPRRLPSDVR